MSYIDGFLVPVPEGNKDAYIAMAKAIAPVFIEHGAIQIVECWGDDVPHGKTTDFYMAVKATESENVVFAWIVWPSKSIRDAGMAKVAADPRSMMGAAMPFDTKRMIFGGFTTVLDERSGA